MRSPIPSLGVIANRTQRVGKLAANGMNRKER